MKSTLGVAVVGLGVGEAHARAYVQLDCCALRWLYDIDHARAAAVSDSLGQGAVAQSYSAVLDDPDVDLVSIASYDDAHFGQVVAALQAGKHVFVEKPLCRSREELREIKRAWSHEGQPHLASNLILREAPVYRWVKQQIDLGTFGRLYAFDGDYLFGRLEKITQGWRAAVPDYSVMLGGGVHLVDLMLWLTGERPDAVTAVGNRICSAGTAFQYDDYTAATFRFSSTLVGRITANFGCVHGHQHVVRIFGTERTFVSDDRGARLYATRDGAARPIELSALPLSKGELIPSFVGRIVDRADSGPEAHRLFDLITACVAADRAAQLGTAVDIDYD